MPIFKRKGAAAYEVMKYTLPKLHTGKSWFVDFFCYDPITQTKRRKKYFLNPKQKASEKKRSAADLIAGITERLRQGWNPWAEQSSERQYLHYSAICDLYIRYIKSLSDKNTLKKSTYNSYVSYLNVFNTWMENKVFPVLYVFQIDKTLISDFLEYMIIEKDVSARTRNNYLVWLATFCGWMVAKGALDSDPTSGIKKIKENEKFREQLSSEQLDTLRTYLSKSNPHFLLACMMEYYTFIRPEELCSIRIGDIFIKEQKVRLSGEFTKNRKDGMVGLNDRIIRLMIELDTFKHDSDEYLFGGRDFKPSPKKQAGRIFRETFQKLRKELRWPACYQFYSLKDTGIRDLANTVGIVVARDQARHSDVKTTNKYLRGDSLTVHEETKHFDGNL